MGRKGTDEDLAIEVAGLLYSSAWSLAVEAELARKHGRTLMEVRNLRREIEIRRLQRENEYSAPRPRVVKPVLAVRVPSAVKAALEKLADERETTVGVLAAEVLEEATRGATDRTTLGQIMALQRVKLEAERVARALDRFAEDWRPRAADSREAGTEVLAIRVFPQAKQKLALAATMLGAKVGTLAADILENAVGTGARRPRAVRANPAHIGAARQEAGRAARALDRFLRSVG